MQSLSINSKSPDSTFSFFINTFSRTSLILSWISFGRVSIIGTGKRLIGFSWLRYLLFAALRSVSAKTLPLNRKIGVKCFALPTRKEAMITDYTKCFITQTIKCALVVTAGYLVRCTHDMTSRLAAWLQLLHNHRAFVIYFRYFLPKW